MYSKIICLTLPEDLVSKIDEAAAAGYASRSDFIRQAIILRLNNQQIVDKPSKDDILESLFGER